VLARGVEAGGGMGVVESERAESASKAPAMALGSDVRR
jgi:hypothetical protein